MATFSNHARPKTIRIGVDDVCVTKVDSQTVSQTPPVLTNYDILFTKLLIYSTSPLLLKNLYPLIVLCL